MDKRQGNYRKWVRIFTSYFVVLFCFFSWFYILYRGTPYILTNDLNHGRWLVGKQAVDLYKEAEQFKSSGDLETYRDKLVEVYHLSQQALRIRPDNPDYLWINALSQYEIGRLSQPTDMKSINEAILSVKKLLDISGYEDKSAWFLIHAAIRTSNYQDALDLLMKLHSADPTNPQIYDYLVDVWIQLKNLDNAIQWLLKKNTQVPQSLQDTDRLARLLVRNNKYIDAIPVLEKLLVHPDETGDYFLLYGICLYKVGKYKAAYTQFRRYHSLQPPGALWPTARQIGLDRYPDDFIFQVLGSFTSSPGDLD